MTMTGIYPILPTPFAPDGSLDLPSLGTLVEFQATIGMDGVAILGFLGEAHKLTSGERRLVIEETVARSAGRLSVWVGVRALGTAGAVEQAREAEALGADAVFVAPIAPQSDPALLEHYRAVARAVSIPLIVHDYPESFGIQLSPELLARLVLDGDVTYIKLEDPPVLQKLSRLHALTEGRIRVFGGLGGLYFLEELQRGAAGIMTGFSYPEVLKRIYDAFRAGDHGTAARVFDRYASLLRYEFQPKVGLALRKHVYFKRGLIAHPHVRPPATALDERTTDEFEALIARLGLPLGPGVADV